MTTIGTALTQTATKVMLLGSGELGKELILELQQLGIETIAVDNYVNAPAQQVAHRSYTISMLDGKALNQLVQQEQPDYIVPEIEAIATEALITLEKQGFNVVPSANAVYTTMNRELIRQLAHEQLGLPTSEYMIATNHAEFKQAVEKIGFPCVVKPIMSSSGRGQSVIKSSLDIALAWERTQEEGRTKHNKVIVEAFVDFDYEITLLTVKHKDGTTFLPAIGHSQKNGDYIQSWQPQQMSVLAEKKAQQIATQITTALSGYGIFAVELFIKGDQVVFNEVAPRPHDTGLVTLISQELSEFALHVRAILGLPVPEEITCRPSASKPIIAEGISKQIAFEHIDRVLSIEGSELRLFAKGNINGHRRLGVVLAHGKSVDDAITKTNQAYDYLHISLK